MNGLRQAQPERLTEQYWDLTGRTRIAIGAPPVLLEQSQAVGNEIILDNLPIGARDATRGFTGASRQSIAANK